MIRVPILTVPPGVDARPSGSPPQKTSNTSIESWTIHVTIPEEGSQRTTEQEPMTQKAPMQKPLTTDEIRAQHEINGARRANTDLIAYALTKLHPGDERTNAERVAALTLEREQAIASLQRLAELSGMPAWPDGLSLPEIIDGHIGSHLALPLGKPAEKSKR